MINCEAAIEGKSKISRSNQSLISLKGSLRKISVEDVNGVIRKTSATPFRNKGDSPGVLDQLSEIKRGLDEALRASERESRPNIFEIKNPIQTISEAESSEKMHSEQFMKPEGDCALSSNSNSLDDEPK